MDWSLLWSIFYGAICGYIASRIIGGDGFGFLGNVVVGILGGIIGRWMVKQFNIDMIGGPMGNLVSSVGGALILILFIEMVKYNRSAKSNKKR
jgi:uncharacterized membrane protein YeaQ/YmgE (transglycosylase-associated protein family)